MNGDQRCMDGDSDSCQMEIVEENGQMIVQPARRWEMQSQSAARYANDATAAASTAAAVGETILLAAAVAVALVGEPQFDDELDVEPLQHLFNLVTVD